MTVSIVIPNWNGEEKLKKNLPKVLKVKEVIEVIVSDDASPDDSIGVIKREFPEVVLIEKKTNTGFADNSNNGVKNAKGDLVFLLNNDATPDEDCVISALKHFEDENVFSVGCSAGGSYSWAKFNDGFFWHFMSGEKVKEAHETLWSSGGSGIFRKSVWEKLGGFDTLYEPFYEEDTDLGYRALKRGYKNIFEPNSRVEHYKEPGVISQSFSKESIYKVAQRNQLIFIWKNITDPELIKQHILGLIKMLLTHPKYWGIFLAALVKLPKVLEKRKIEKREQKVSDLEILNKYN